MRVIGVVMTKGGTGKTTCALTLAVEAVRDGDRVALLDLNEDQGSLYQWWEFRGEPDNPHLARLDGDIHGTIVGDVSPISHPRQG